MNKKITRFNILQTGKFMAVFYALLTVIFIPFFLLAALGEPAALGPMIPMLLLYPLMGFIGGIIMAAFYNLTARWIGGIEVTLDDAEPVVPAEPAPDA